MPDLDAAVRAEIAAFTPGAHPPLAAIYARRARRRRRGAVATAACAVAATGAAAVALAPSREPREAAGPPAPDRPLMLTCRTGPDFPASALTAPLGAERGDDPAAAALRAFLRSPERRIEMTDFPLTGWRALVRADHEALFATDGLRQVLHLDVGTDGRWGFAGGGGCRPTVAPPPGTGVASWAPSPPVGPEDRAFTAIVSEQSCASGRSPEGRIEPPVVEYSPTAVTVTFFVRRATGGATCQGAPPAEYPVVLREPLGDRRLLDGHAYPPIEAGSEIR